MMRLNKIQEYRSMTRTKLQPADYLFWAVKQQTGNQLRNHILIILADHLGKKGQCNPSHATIAKRCECSDRAVRKQISILEKDGWVSVKRKAVDGIKTSSEYGFPLATKDRNEVPNDRNVVPMGTELGSVGVRNEVPIKHPVLNTQLNTINPIVPFDAFYAAYPKKVGRTAAKKAWDKLNPKPALITRIMNDLKARVEQGHWCTGPGKQFIPGPAPYLNQHRWEDEIIPSPEKQTKTNYAEISASFEEI